ncbi:hypothetical protein M8494_03510 [Serratia ureilytica]
MIITCLQLERLPLSIEDAVQISNKDSCIDRQPGVTCRRCDRSPAARCESVYTQSTSPLADKDNYVLPRLPSRYQDMEYRRCGRSGLKLPAVSLGLWHNFGDATLYDNARGLIRCAFDRGITHFDLANNYGPPPGAAEENLAAYSTPICGPGAMS